MAKNVTTIPATRNRFTADPISSRKKRKVAGYARVSTDMEDQQTSYAAQCDYYTSYIQSREDWEFVGLYSDEGISATSTRHREGFNKMVEDALDGKIDLIITKSVSRFARNTVDTRAWCIFPWYCPPRFHMEISQMMMATLAMLKRTISTVEK